MRLLYVTRRAWPAIGGIETLVHDVAQGVSQDNEVTVMAIGTDNSPISPTSDGPRQPRPFRPFQDGGVSVTPLQMSRLQRLALAPLLLQQFPLLRRYAYGRARIPLAWLYAHAVAPSLESAVAKADLVHIWTDGFPAAAALLAAERAARPVVITPFMHRWQWGDDPGSVAVYKRANRVIALLSPEAADYRDLGVSSDRILVSGACSPGVVPPRGATVHTRYGITGPLVLYLGARTEHKGFRLLLEAARQLPEAAGVTVAFGGPGVSVDLAGTPSGARLLDLGLLSTADRAAWLHAADMLCLPSAGETFGIVLLEAWSVGTPVLTSDTPSLKRLVGQSRGGRVVPREASALAEAIVAMTEDPKGLKAMGAAGRRYWREHFTVELVAGWHQSLYRTLV